MSSPAASSVSEAVGGVSAARMDVTEAEAADKMQDSVNEAAPSSLSDSGVAGIVSTATSKENGVVDNETRPTNGTKAAADNGDVIGLNEEPSEKSEAGGSCIDASETVMISLTSPNNQQLVQNQQQTPEKFIGGSAMQQEPLRSSDENNKLDNFGSKEAACIESRLVVEPALSTTPEETAKSEPTTKVDALAPAPNNLLSSLSGQGMQEAQEHLTKMIKTSSGEDLADEDSTEKLMDIDEKKPSQVAVESVQSAESMTDFSTEQEGHSAQKRVATETPSDEHSPPKRKAQDQHISDGDGSSKASSANDSVVKSEVAAVTPRVARPRREVARASAGVTVARLSRTPASRNRTPATTQKLAQAQETPSTPTRTVAAKRGHKTLESSQKQAAVELDIPQVIDAGGGGTDVDTPGSLTSRVLVTGSGDFGQLGIGEAGENGKPRFVAVADLPGDEVKVGRPVRCAAGAMHSLVLTDKGCVFSFGCNDDGSLGRATPEEADSFLPRLVNIPFDIKVVKIAAGNVHSVALTTACRILIWGAYRDSNGPFGIQPDNEKSLREPTDITDLIPERILDIAAGSDHTIFLSEQGNLFTMGCAEQGRLGRVRKSHCCRENRRARQVMLTPGKVSALHQRKVVRFDRIFAGRFTTFARASDGQIWGCGLNNFSQLGSMPSKLLDDHCCFQMVPLPAFSSEIKWEAVASGEQHTLALDSEGRVFALGRALYGRLGLGKERSGADYPDVTKPTLVEGSLSGKKVVAIAAGDHSSFAQDSDGNLYSWGQGSDMLGQGNLESADEQDIFEPTLCTSKALKSSLVFHFSAGGTHAISVVQFSASSEGQ